MAIWDEPIAAAKGVEILAHQTPQRVLLYSDSEDVAMEAGTV